MMRAIVVVGRITELEKQMVKVEALEKRVRGAASAARKTLEILLV